jgi:hypothetical protein
MSDNLLMGVRRAETPSDGVAFGEVARGFYCESSGDVVLVMEDGVSVTFAGIAAGIIHPIRFLSMTSFDGTGELALF